MRERTCEGSLEIMYHRLARTYQVLVHVRETSIRQELAEYGSARSVPSWQSLNRASL
jgi:hypothetical protein